jgi:opine dehydrogenase
MTMRVAILGAGAIGCASAALLCQNGHGPVLWSPSGRRTAALAASPLTATGAVEGQFRPAIAATCAEALAGAAAVLIAVPGYAHRAVIDAAVPHLHPGQTVLFSSHMSFSLLYLLKRRAPYGAPPAAVAWGTTVVTGRQTGPCSVLVNHIRTKVDAAPIAAANTVPGGLALCTALFGDRFVLRDNLTAIGLSNLNPQNHLAIALCNLTRMERGETWLQYANTTGAVGRLMEALDAERLAIAAGFGLTVRTLHEHFRLSFGATGSTMAAMAHSLATAGADVAGPATLDSRYVTEDVPFGLWPTIRLAQVAGVPAPLHEAGVRIMSALYGRDFAAENDILPALGDLAAALAAGGG